MRGGQCVCQNRERPTVWLTCHRFWLDKIAWKSTFLPNGRRALTPKSVYICIESGFDLINDTVTTFGTGDSFDLLAFFSTDEVVW